jgi:quercetin dioxygenase-like cupin family protein
MQTLFRPLSERAFTDHPKFAGVRIAVLVSADRSAAVGVSLLEIAPGIGVPVHVHDPNVDSIYVLSGHGEALINGEWKEIAQGDYLFVPAHVEHGVRNNGSRPLGLLVHHSPPLF